MRKDGSEGRLHLEYVSRLKLKLKQLTDRHQLCRGGGGEGDKQKGCS